MNLRVGLIACLTVFGVMAAEAQAPFQVISAGVRARDAVLDVSANSIYLAVYDRNEVWRVDPVSHETTAKTPVGQGPAALALAHGGKVLACVNRLSGTLSLIQLPELTVLDTVKCGNGAHDVAALPGGGFAVTNSFADTVTLVDTARPPRVRTLANVRSVPVAVAAGESALAVATREPPALLLFRGGDETPTVTVALPDVPAALATWDANTIIAATKSRLLVVDAETGAITAQREMAALDVAVDGGRILALTDQSVQVLNAKLQPAETLELTVAGRALAAADACTVVLAPTEKSWAISGTLEPLLAATPSPTPPASEVPQQEPVVRQEEEEKAPTSETSPEPEPPAAPTPALPDTPVTPPPSPVETAPVEEKAKEPERPASAEDAGKDAGGPRPVASEERPTRPKTSRPEGAALRRMPLGAQEPEATEAGRPSPIPGPPPGEKTISEALTGKPDIGSSEGGFTLPEWVQSVPAQADEVKGDREVLRLKGNVRFQVDTLHITADQFMLNKITREMEAEDNVVVTQEMASLTADRIHYTVPKEEELPLTAPFGLSKEEENRLRLRYGAVEADNVHLVEPTREITADHLQYDFAANTGELINAEGRAGEFFFGAKTLRVLGPASADGEDVWVTTCDRDPPHYRVRLKKASIREGKAVTGTGARLQLGKANTPAYWPKWSQKGDGRETANFDFKSGREAQLGYYVNFGQQFSITPNIDLGYRLLPTSGEGIGFGLDSYYDYMETPASPMFRSKGEVHGLYTTKDRGYWQVYHRQEAWDDTVLLIQSEQWSDEDFYKDFFYNKYRNRTEPRTFANLTLTKPTYLATATVRHTTNNFVAETERAPEFTYHLLERNLTDHLYVSFDAVEGYNEREPAGTHALRLAHVGRLTYDWDITEAWNLTPYYEAEATWYSNEVHEEDSNARFSNTLGATLQTRFHRAFPGAFGFSAFKHVIAPSVTYSYRPRPTMPVENTPRFDALDNVYGRSRIESKIDNILFGRDEKSGQTWPVARLTLYQGNDFSNELRKAEDYEIELDVRPRQYWGTQLAWEHHSIRGDFDIDAPFALQQTALELYEYLFGKPFNPEVAYRYNARYGDYNRFLSYLYYDDRPLGGKLNGRLGFAYTETQDNVFNREILYGAGYRIGEHWGVSFEHRYDFERDKLYQQVYEIRRDLHCWEASVQLRDRESGWDIGLAFNIKAFPGSKVKF